MSSLRKYAYICSKIRGMRSSLLTTKALYDVMGHDLKGIYAFLKTTAYNEDVSAVPMERFTARFFEEASAKHFIKTYMKILKSSPEDVQTLLLEILKKFEVENLKALLRAKMAEFDVEEAVQHVVPLTTEDEPKYREIYSKAGTVEELIKILFDTEYGPVLELALLDYQEKKVLLPIEVSLDKYLYAKMWAEADKLNGENRLITKEVIGTEIDGQNIKIALRCRALNIAKEDAPKYFIPIFYNLSLDDLEGSVTMTSIGNSIQAFLMVKPYTEIVSAALREYEESKSLSQVEQVLERLPLRTSLRILKQHPYPFHIGVILAFLNLKWAEVRNLRVIVRGIESELPPEKIRKFLILP